MGNPTKDAKDNPVGDFFIGFLRGGSKGRG